MGPKFKVAHVEDALRRSAGVVTAAANILEQAYGSCTPATVRNYLKRHPSLRRAVDEIVETNLDNAEGTLIKAFIEGNLTATIFYLKTKGRARGYVERIGYVDKDNEPSDAAPSAPYVVVLPDNGRDGPDDTDERDPTDAAAGPADPVREMPS